MSDEEIAVDLADVFSTEDDDYMRTLAWGDRVEVTGRDAERITVRIRTFRERSDGTQDPVDVEGYIRIRRSAGDRPVTVPAGQQRVLKVDFVDVQQGDGAVVETPDGRVLLIDGGDNQLFARYLAGRYPGSSAEQPKEIDAIVVTHGDADHFAGLTEIRRSEDHPSAAKRLFARPLRVFHNGLVKRGASTPERERLGETATIGGRLAVTGLVDDPRDVPSGEANRPFGEWGAALDHWQSRGPIEVRRLARGDDDAFAFLRDEKVSVEVLGPIPVRDGERKALAFLGTPRRRYGHPSRQPQTAFGAPSASHTINGHSIVLRIRFGDWRMLFAGDLNEEAETTLVDAHDAKEVDLRSEVFKVPHHGSADFLHRFLGAVNPVVSVISSGDEQPSKEYIHPRATLVSGLGRYGRDHDPVIFITELVAFFRMEGWVQNQPPDDGRDWSERRKPFFAFTREAFGIVKIRTDGQRLLVYTNSGQARMKEAYAYTLQDGLAVPQAISRA